MNKIVKNIDRRYREMNEVINQIWFYTNFTSFKLKISLYGSCLFFPKLKIYLLMLVYFNSFIVNFSKKLSTKSKYLAKSPNFFISNKTISVFLFRYINVFNFKLKEII